MVRDRSSSLKIDYVIVIQNFLNPEGHQNPISCSKDMAILPKGWILPIGGASVGEGLRLRTPKMHRRFCIGRPQVSLNLLLLKFRRQGILLTIAIIKK